MLQRLPLSLLSLLAFYTSDSHALPDRSFLSSWLTPPRNLQPRSALENGTNGTFLWVIQDTYQGSTFFECGTLQLALFS
jgi:hypothetical protein